MEIPRFETLDVTVEVPVARVWLNRPSVRNAINDQMIAELTHCFRALAETPSVRVIILGGYGPIFCAGADVEWMRRAAELTERENRADAQALATMLDTIDRTPAVVIARVQGAALGGGMGLCAVADIVVTTPDTKFGFTEVRLGIVPAVISPFVARKVGETFMRRYFLTGERFTADVAERIGLVHEVVAESDLDDRLEALVDAVRRGGPEAVRIAKTLIRMVTRLSRESAIALAVDMMARLRMSPEGQEGLRAFLEKRPPIWLEGDEQNPL